MKKYAKISFILVLALMVTTISAFAATRSVYRFDTTLPANQGDEELEPVARDSDGSRFLIGFSDIDEGYTTVRAWAESEHLHVNKSDPYQSFPADGNSYYGNYYSDDIPGRGVNLILNMDNPVKTSKAVHLAGFWDPL